MIDYRMQFNLVLFCAAVCVCVAWTRLLYYDGLHRKLARLRRHCLLQAGMIVSISGWAVSIGIYIQAASMSVIQEQRATIQNLATGQNHRSEFNAAMAQPISSLVAYETIEVTTPAGVKITRNSTAGTSGRNMLSGTAGRDRFTDQVGCTGDAEGRNRCTNHIDSGATAGRIGGVSALPGSIGANAIVF